MTEIEVPEELDDDEAEKILQQRAKARSGSKKPKRVAGGDDSGWGGFLIALLALVLWGLSELGITFF